MKQRKPIRERRVIEKKAASPHERWSLYWVVSDGFEDCFVAARNSRSACSVEVHMNGFDLDEVAAHRICGIPRDLAEVYQATEAYEKRPWPWYVYGKEILMVSGQNSGRLTVKRKCFFATWSTQSKNINLLA